MGKCGLIADHLLSQNVDWLMGKIAGFKQQLKEGYSWYKQQEKWMLRNLEDIFLLSMEWLR
jgi:hypothetical protein